MRSIELAFQGGSASLVVTDLLHGLAAGRE
jgi:hypothetical protein